MVVKHLTSRLVVAIADQEEGGRGNPCGEVPTAARRAVEEAHSALIVCS